MQWSFSEWYDTSRTKITEWIIWCATSFQSYPSAAISGITEVYLKIELSPDDRCFHRFLWRIQSLMKSHVNMNSVDLYLVLMLHHIWLNLCHSTMLEYLKISILGLQKLYYSPLTWMIAWIIMSESEGIILYKQQSELWGKARMHAHT